MGQSLSCFSAKSQEPSILVVLHPLNKIINIEKEINIFFILK